MPRAGRGPDGGGGRPPPGAALHALNNKLWPALLVLALVAEDPATSEHLRALARRAQAELREAAAIAARLRRGPAGGVRAGRVAIRAAR